MKRWIFRRASRPAGLAFPSALKFSNNKFILFDNTGTMAKPAALPEGENAVHAKDVAAVRGGCLGEVFEADLFL